jgi:U3 small nucleolar RNA-associated protein 25
MGDTDVFGMQNWAHVKTIFDVLNVVPKDAHGADFSRIR